MALPQKNNQYLQNTHLIILKEAFCLISNWKQSALMSKQLPLQQLNEQMEKMQKVEALTGHFVVVFEASPRFCTKPKACLTRILRTHDFSLISFYRMQTKSHSIILAKVSTQFNNKSFQEFYEPIMNHITITRWPSITSASMPLEKHIVQ